MTERRPHWTDDLIDAVFRRMDGYAAGVVRSEAEHGTPTFDIIAAVEDSLNPNWDSMQELCRMQNESLGEKLAVIEALQAAIARVRERAELRFGIPAVQGAYQAGYAAAMNDILNALEGGQR